jgi:hypothetical protein
VIGVDFKQAARSRAAGDLSEEIAASGKAQTISQQALYALYLTVGFIRGDP